MLRNYTHPDDGIDLETFDKEAEIAKFEDLEAVGWNIYVRLFTPANTGSVLRTDEAQSDFQYTSKVGLVVKMGKGVYKDERYKDTGEWCKVGDWVHFNRTYGDFNRYINIPTCSITEDKIIGKVKNPSNLTN
jgi:hypothetical protein